MDSQTPCSEENAGHLSASEDSRRRFLKAGLVVAPLLITLAARPIQAQSGFVAGSLGTHGSGVGSGVAGEDLVPLGAGDPNEFGAL